MEPEEDKRIRDLVRERTMGYIVGALGLVAGLAWNDAIKSLIEVKAKDRIGEAKFEKDYEKLLNDIKKQIESEIETLAKGERR